MAQMLHTELRVFDDAGNFENLTAISSAMRPCFEYMHWKTFQIKGYIEFGTQPDPVPCPRFGEPFHDEA